MANKALKSVSYDLNQLAIQRPVKRPPLKYFVRQYLLNDEQLAIEIQQLLPPNGRTGRSSFDQAKAVNHLRKYDSIVKDAPEDKPDPRRGHNHLRGINDAGAWKVLQDVLKDFGIMSYGQLIANESVGGDELDDSIEQDDVENDIKAESATH